VNTFLIIILAIIVARYALDTLSSILNVRHLRETLPESFVGIFDDEKYTTSQRYLRTNTRFGIISDTVSTVSPWVDSTLLTNWRAARRLIRSFQGYFSSRYLC
jgi:hypothetical protein